MPRYCYLCVSNFPCKDKSLILVSKYADKWCRPPAEGSLICDPCRKKYGKPLAKGSPLKSNIKRKPRKSALKPKVKIMVDKSTMVLEKGTEKIQKLKKIKVRPLKKSKSKVAAAADEDGSRKGSQTTLDNPK